LNPISLEFFYKEECHLCEDMEQQLTNYLKKNSIEDRVTVVKCDIEEKDSWYQYYREYVPVLVLGETEVCHYFFDEGEMDSVLGKAGSFLSDNT
jgi:hypothetical protein